MEPEPRRRTRTPALYKTASPSSFALGPGASQTEGTEAGLPVVLVDHVTRGNKAWTCNILCRLAGTGYRPKGVPKGLSGSGPQGPPRASLGP